MTQKKPTPEQETKFMAILKTIYSDHNRNIIAELTPWEAHMITSLIQLAYRHPGLSPIMKFNAKKTGAYFQKMVVDQYPDAKEEMDLGWNTDYDVDVEDHQ